MRVLFLFIFLLLSSHVMSQDTLDFHEVFDWDGYKKRIHFNTGYWIYTDSTLTKIEGQYRTDYVVTKKTRDTYHSFNDFGEEVTYTISKEEVTVRNLAHAPQYTVYRKKPQYK